MPLFLYGSGGRRGSNVRRHLAKHLPVVSRQHQVSLLIHLHIHSIGQHVLDGVRVAEEKLSHPALHIGPIPDPHDVHFGGEPGRHALHRIRR